MERTVHSDLPDSLTVGDVDKATIDFHVLVGDKLTGGAAGRCKTHPVHRVVET